MVKIPDIDEAISRRIAAKAAEEVAGLKLEGIYKPGDEHTKYLIAQREQRIDEAFIREMMEKIEEERTQRLEKEIAEDKTYYGKTSVYHEQAFIKSYKRYETQYAEIIRKVADPDYKPATPKEWSDITKSMDALPALFNGSILEPETDEKDSFRSTSNDTGHDALIPVSMGGKAVQGDEPQEHGSKKKGNPALIEAQGKALKHLCNSVVKLHACPPQERARIPDQQAAIAGPLVYKALNYVYSQQNGGAQLTTQAINNMSNEEIIALYRAANREFKDHGIDFANWQQCKNNIPNLEKALQSKGINTQASLEELGQKDNAVALRDKIKQVVNDDRESFIAAVNAEDYPTRPVSPTELNKPQIGNSPQQMLS